MIKQFTHSATCILCILLALAAPALLVPTAQAFPTPAAVPTRWELDFQPGELRLYVDPSDGRAYWYFTYKVVNNTGLDRYWAPRFTLFTDTGRIMNSGEAVEPAIERRLIELAGNRYTERQNQVIGTLFVGEQHAIDGLVVWPAHDAQVTRLDLFVSGISGESVEVTRPVSGKKEVLHKTLQRSYIVAGNPFARGDDPVPLESESWVMR